MVSHSRDVGGVDRHILQVIQDLCSRGHCLNYAGLGESWVLSKAKESGAQVIPLQMKGHFDLWSVIELARLCRALGIDIVHGHHTRGSRYALMASAISRVPTVVSAHVTTACKHFRNAKSIIAVSGAVRDYLTTVGCRLDAIEVIDNCIQIEAPPPESRMRFRNKFLIHQDDYVFGSVARFSPEKGQDVLIRAFSNSGCGAKLLLGGDCSTCFGLEMQQLALSLGVLDRVIFTGTLEDPMPAYAAMDAFVMPSRREACPLALLEAAYLKLPLLGSNVGGIPGIIRNGENGMLVESEDLVAWAEAMKFFFDNREEMKALGARNHSFHGDRFRTEPMVDQILASYHKCIQNQRR